MRIKRYVAGTMQQAVAMVKADFGDDAVILHTKKFRRGLFGLFGVPRVEVIAAVEPGGRQRTASRGKRREQQKEQQLSHAQEATTAALQTLQEEVRSLRRLIGEQHRTGELLPPGLQNAFNRLQAQEIPEAECYELVELIMKEARPRI